MLGDGFWGHFLAPIMFRLQISICSKQNFNSYNTYNLWGSDHRLRVNSACSRYIWKACTRSKKFAQRSLLNCDHGQAGFWFTLSTELVLFPSFHPAFCRWEYVLQLMESWMGPGGWGVWFQIPCMNLATHIYRRQHGLHCNKEWPSSKLKWLKILTQHYLFVSEICRMMGSRFLR